MKYLWIGLQFEQTIKNIISSCGTKVMSGKVSEDSILNGLYENGIKLDSINSFRIPVFPKSSMLFCKRYSWQNNGQENVSVSYLNLKYINQISRTFSLKREARLWAKKHKNEDVTIFVYSMHSPFLAAAAEIKKIIPCAKIVLIVLDLPQYMDLGMSRFKKILKAFDWKKLQKQMRFIDKYILYSKHMATFLGLKDGSWTVMEGSFDPTSLVEENPEKTANKISVMYSGVVDMRYGIPELLDAMKLLDENYELWITGGGNAASLIKEKAKEDGRIKFFGFLPSRKDLLLKQKSASMLISTRRPDEAASDYCFPSKLFEYMISGNPVLSCRIGGIPDEYFDYLIEMKSVSPEGIAQAIKKVAAMPVEDRTLLGKKSKDFILREKNNFSQAKKIIDFINEV